MKPPGPLSDDAPAQSLLRLGSRIRLARTRRKLRQEDLARQIGRARATVVAIEKGSPKTEIGAYVAALWALGLLQKSWISLPILVLIAPARPSSFLRSISVFGCGSN